VKRKLLANNVGSALSSLLNNGRTFYAPFADAGSGSVSLVASGAGASQAATFTRATTATTVDSSGLIVSVASGVARSYYDPTTLEYRGYLAEGARTNLLLRSEEFDNASWTKTDTTITANSIVAPDGATTADLMTEGSAGTARVDQAATITANATVTVSRFIKRGDTDWVRLEVFETAVGGNRIDGWFNLATGSVGSATNTGTATGASVSIKAYSNGFYRCILSGAVNNGATAVTFMSASATANASTSRVASSTRYEWGAQFENSASFASSYIPTTTAAVTRNADALTYDASNWNATAGTCYAEASCQWTASPLGIIIGSAASSTIYPLGVQFAAAATTVQTRDGTNNIVKSGLSSMATGVRKRAASWGAAGLLAGGDGLAMATGSYDGNNNAGTGAIGIGCDDASAVRNWFGTIRNVRIYSTQFTDAQLQAITA